MRVGLLMGEKKKPPKNSGGKKQNPGVKLTPLFHHKLKVVSAAAKIDMGPLIEREMEEFVNREWERRFGTPPPTALPE